jgi:hypothetical protein
MVVRPLQAFGSSDIPRSVPRASTAGPDRGLDLHGVSTECRPDILLWTIMSARHAVPGLVITISWLCFSRSMVAIVGGLWLSSPCYSSIAPSILGCSNKVGFHCAILWDVQAFKIFLLICEMQDFLQILLHIFSMVVQYANYKWWCTLHPNVLNSCWYLIMDGIKVHLFVSNWSLYFGFLLMMPSIVRSLHTISPLSRPCILFLYCTNGKYARKLFHLV